MGLVHIIEEVVPVKTIGGGFSVIHFGFAISLQRNRLDCAAKTSRSTYQPKPYYC
jgi:hypothetical protein